MKIREIKEDMAHYLDAINERFFSRLKNRIAPDPLIALLKVYLTNKADEEKITFDQFKDYAKHTLKKDETFFSNLLNQNSPTANLFQMWRLKENCQLAVSRSIENFVPTLDPIQFPSSQNSLFDKLLTVSFKSPALEMPKDMQERYNIETTLTSLPQITTLVP